jgi:hypothetical protein
MEFPRTPEAEPAAEQAAEPAAEQAGEPGAEPAAEQAAEPAAEQAAEPAAEQAAEPAAAAPEPKKRRRPEPIYLKLSSGPTKLARRETVVVEVIDDPVESNDGVECTCIVTHTPMPEPVVFDVDAPAEEPDYAPLSPHYTESSGSESSESELDFISSPPYAPLSPPYSSSPGEPESDSDEDFAP